jgi:hypothetical protein
MDSLNRAAYDDFFGQCLPWQAFIFLNDVV